MCIKDFPFRVIYTLKITFFPICNHDLFIFLGFLYPLTTFVDLLFLKYLVIALLLTLLSNFICLPLFFYTENIATTSVLMNDIASIARTIRLWYPHVDFSTEQ